MSTANNTDWAVRSCLFCGSTYRNAEPSHSICEACDHVLFDMEYGADPVPFGLPLTAILELAAAGRELGRRREVAAAAKKAWASAHKTRGQCRHLDCDEFYEAQQARGDTREGLTCLEYVRGGFGVMEGCDVCKPRIEANLAMQSASRAAGGALRSLMAAYRRGAGRQ